MMLKFYLRFLFLLLILSNLISCGYPCDCIQPTPYPPTEINITANYNDMKDDIETLEPQMLSNIYSYSSNEKSIFISNATSGIYVFDNSDMKSPKQISFIRLPNVEYIKVINNILYAFSMGDIATLEISDLKKVKLLDRTTLINDKSNENVNIGIKYKKFKIESENNLNNSNFISSSNDRLIIIEDYLYFLNANKLYIIDISNKIKPKLIKQLQIIKDQANDSNKKELISSICISNDFLAISSYKKLYLYSIKDLSDPILTSTLDYEKYKGKDIIKNAYTAGVSISINESKIYLKLSRDSIDVINIGENNKPNPIFSNNYKISEIERNSSMAIKNNKLFIGGDNTEIRVYDISNNLDIIPITRFDFGILKFSLTNQNTCLVLNSDFKLLQYDLTDIKDNLKPLSIIQRYYTGNIGSIDPFDGEERYDPIYFSYLEKKKNNEVKK